jgi:hypothetical protein
MEYVRFGLRDQGIVVTVADMILNVLKHHLLFLVRHVGISDPSRLASYLDEHWNDVVFEGLNGKYILKVDNMEIDSRPGETEVNIKYIKI